MNALVNGDFRSTFTSALGLKCSQAEGLLAMSTANCPPDLKLAQLHFMCNQRYAFLDALPY